MDDKDGVVFCTKIATAAVVEPGSRAEICAKCKEPIWLAPTTLVALKDNGHSLDSFDLICMECIAKLPDIEEAKPMKLTKEQLGSIKGMLEEAKNKPLDLSITANEGISLITCICMAAELLISDSNERNVLIGAEKKICTALGVDFDAMIREIGTMDKHLNGIKEALVKDLVQSGVFPPEALEVFHRAMESKKTDRITADDIK